MTAVWLAFVMVAVFVSVTPLTVSGTSNADCSSVGANSNQENIVGWANYFYNIMWTAQRSVTGWKYTFSQGESYHIPYSQPVNTNGYIGFGVSVEDFINATNDANSVFYTSHSEYGRTSTYYGMDCTSFVSACWGVSRRTNFSGISTKIGDLNSSTVNSLQIGDTLENSEHAILITGISYDGDRVSSIEVTEATPPQLKRTVWSASSFASYYGARSYIIERYKGSVPAPPNEPVIPPTPTGSITVTDGDYYISTALDNNKVLDIDAGQISNNKANAQLWELLNGQNQVFTVRHIGNGYYNIICKESGKCLEVDGGNTAAGTNVQQYDGNGTDAQQWVIKETGDGYYNIVSKCNGLYLDVDNYNTNNGTNIKVYSGNASDAQKWRFTLLGSHTFCDGDYYITSALDNNKVLDIDLGQISNNQANAQLWELLHWQNQVFTVKHIGDGYYNIICKESGKCLEIEDGYAHAGANVQQYDNNGTDAQQWVIKEVGNNYFCIVSKRNGLCLDVDNYRTDNGTNIKVYSGYLSDAQKWRFIPVGDHAVIDGEYYISTALDNNKVLDIDAGQISENKANAQLWELLNWENQVFSLVYNDNGYYSIICNKSGKYLEVEGGYKEAGTNVQQYEGNGTDAQQWVIKPTGDGYYYIVSKCNGLYLDVDNYNTDNGTNIKVYTGYLTNAQKWRFIPLGTQTVSDGEYYISSALNNDKVLDIDDEQISNDKANAQLWDWLNGTNQVFSLKYNDNGYYNIICNKSGKYLEVEGGLLEAGTNVQQYEGNGTDAQQWVIKPAGDGYYYIVSKCNGLHLDVDNSSTENGTNIKVYTGYSTNAQKWKFIQYTKPIEPSNSICGDTNLDGNIDIRDVTAIQRHLTELETFNEEQLSVADTNGDGEINIADATHLQMYLAEYDLQLG